MDQLLREATGSGKLAGPGSGLVGLAQGVLRRALQMLVTAVRSSTGFDNRPVGRTCAVLSSHLVTSPLPFSSWQFEVTALLLNGPWSAAVTPPKLPISCLSKFNFANPTSSVGCQQSKCDFFQERQ